MAKRPRKNKDEKLVKGGPTEDNALKIVPVLQGYWEEANAARKGGLNPRDDKWEENLHLYWNRMDTTRKANWQAREFLPEVSNFVDRFAASLKDALVTGPSGFYSVEDPADKERDLTDAVKRMTDVWLSSVGHNQTGTCLGFPAVFEEQIKMGAMMACASTVVWKEDAKYGRVAIDPIDPRNVWLDHTGRNLYRIRRREIDKHELRDMVKMKDGRGRPIYNTGALDQMVTHIAVEAQQQEEQRTGAGAFQSSTRQPVTIDEYIATVVANDGTVLAKNALMVVGNDKFLLRGPEPNPFWHGKDWLVYSPLVTAPLSVYGRSYMEDFGSLAKTFNNLTNLILDAVQVSTMNIFTMVPTLLIDPSQAAEGIWPNKTFFLEEGNRPEDFLKAIDMGSLGPEPVQIWQAMKNELREAADQNEIGLGQLAPNSRTSATEISQTQESASALVRSIAQTVETRYLNPTLDLVWKTGLQHARADDRVLMDACGEDMYKALLARRRELITRPITFQAQGISTLIQKGRMLRALLQLVQFLASSDILMQAFMQKVDIEKFIKLLFHLSDIDLSKISVSERDRLMAQAAQQMQQAGQGAGSAPAAEGAPAAEMGGVLNTLGVARG